jgi:hypothetical protein
MGAVVRVPVSVAAVEPGASVSLELMVRNTGTVVDQFNFEILGSAADWSTFEPPTVSLFPQGEEAVKVTFSPPRAANTTSGSVPFGIRVESREDPEGTVVEEGTLNVTEFSDVIAELTPHATRVWLRGRSQVAVDNRSNIKYRAELLGTDGDSAFAYSFRPALIEAAPGSVAFAKVTVRPKSTYWRGPSIAEPYQVALRQHMNGAAAGPEVPAGTHPPEVNADGAILRDALLPAWIWKAVAGMVALTAVLALLWFALVKPQIAAATQSAVKKQVTPISMALNHVSSTVPSSAGPPTSSTSRSSGARPASTVTPTSSPTGGQVTTAGSPVNTSLTVSGNNSTVSYAVPKGKALEVTDILLQNSAGASGDVYLQDSGKVLMSWALADFRDLDYHWITPVYFRPDSKLQLTVKDCTGACEPSLYFAGNMKSADNEHDRPTSPAR